MAGLAQVTLRMAADSRAEDLSREARTLCLDLVERFDPDAPLGYRGEAELRERRGADVDATLLDGAAGPGSCYSRQPPAPTPGGIARCCSRERSEAGD